MPDRKQLEKQREAGRVAYQKGDFQQAEELLLAVAATYPDDAWTWIWLGRTLGKQEHQEEAKAAFNEAIRLKPGLLAAERELLSLAASSGKVEEAVAYSRRLATEYPEDKVLIAEIMRRMQQLGDDAEVVWAADLLLKQQRSHKAAWIAKIGALYGLDRNDEANASLTAAERFVPAPEYLPLRVRQLLVENNPALAYDVLSQSRHPFRDSQLLSGLSTALWQRGAVLEAVLVLERAIALRPHDNAVQAMRAQRLDVLRLLTTAPPAPATLVDQTSDVVVVLVADAGKFLAEHANVTLLEAHRASGYEPHMVVLLPAPWNSQAVTIQLEETVGGYPVHTLLPHDAPGIGVNEVTAQNVEALSALFGVLRPSVVLSTNLMGLIAGPRAASEVGALAVHHASGVSRADAIDIDPDLPAEVGGDLERHLLNSVAVVLPPQLTAQFPIREQYRQAIANAGAG